MSKDLMSSLSIYIQEGNTRIPCGWPRSAYDLGGEGCQVIGADDTKSSPYPWGVVTGLRDYSCKPDNAQ